VKRPLAAFVGALLLASCGGEAPRATSSPEDERPGRPWLVERAQETGLDFVHENGREGHFWTLEIMGPGAALFDYDNDGDLDVYVTQGGPLGALGRGETVDWPTDRMFRNELQDGALRFTDVTEAARIAPGGYGMGVAAGDYDNDGWTDLYVTNYDGNRLLRNRGDGSFEDVTTAAGAGEGRFSTSAAFGDFDGDGWLDLYVANYVRFEMVYRTRCSTPDGSPDYCGPQTFPPEPDRLLRNRGDGTFEDVSQAMGIAARPGPGLGVVIDDLTGDGRPDYYVANDLKANHFWVNQGERFLEDAVAAGAAFSMDGKAEASMGLTAGDVDDDGDLDLFMTHIIKQKNTLYVNDGGGLFRDATARFGLDASSRPSTGFGAFWFDVDSDGRLDLFAANGAVKKNEALAREGVEIPLDEANQLFLNQGDDGFREASRDAGLSDRTEVSRGAAVGDLDNDGDADVVVLNNAGRLRLLENRIADGAHWLGIRAIDGGRDALGAKATLHRVGSPAKVRRIATDGSYLSSNDPRALFGLGDDATAGDVEVAWPDGTRERWRDLATDRYWTLTRGEGELLVTQARRTE